MQEAERRNPALIAPYAMMLNRDMLCAAPLRRWLRWTLWVSDAAIAEGFSCLSPPALARTSAGESTSSTTSGAATVAPASPAAHRTPQQEEEDRQDAMRRLCAAVDSIPVDAELRQQMLLEAQHMYTFQRRIMEEIDVSGAAIFVALFKLAVAATGIFIVSVWLVRRSIS